MIVRHRKQVEDLLKKYIENGNIKTVLDAISNILSDIEPENPFFHGFVIGDKVYIDRVKNIIISYDGKPEGFSEDDVGKTGIITKFDKKTMGQRNVFIDTGSEIISGDYHSISKVNKEVTKHD